MDQKGDCSFGQRSFSIVVYIHPVWVTSRQTDFGPFSAIGSLISKILATHLATQAYGSPDNFHTVTWLRWDFTEALSDRSAGKVNSS
jgi:hypothetical protein